MPLLRMNDRTYPWLILVPKRADIREIIDLSDDDQHQLTREVAEASRALRRLLIPTSSMWRPSGTSCPSCTFTSSPASPVTPPGRDPSGVSRRRRRSPTPKPRPSGRAGRLR